MEGPKIIFATGSRKRAVARIRLKEGVKPITIVNGKDLKTYFGREDLIIHALEPLKVTGLEGKFAVIAKIEGGGLSGQAGALRHAIARALFQYDETLKPTLKKYGMLSRDPREKERMKYGKSKRRKSPQYSKR